MAVVSIHPFIEVFIMRSIDHLPLLLFSILTIAILSSCTKSIDQPAEIADSIVLFYPTGPQMGVIDYLDGFNVWIKNETKYCINFPPDYGIKVFAEIGNVVIEVPNLVTYLGTQPILLEPKGEDFSEHSVSVWPDVINLELKMPTNFYAQITGYLCDDEGVAVIKKIPFIVVP
jgi:hypothetical protein